MSNYCVPTNFSESYLSKIKKLNDCYTSKVREVYDSFKIENLVDKYEISGPLISLAIKSLDKNITSFKGD